MHRHLHTTILSVSPSPYRPALQIRSERFEEELPNSHTLTQPKIIRTEVQKTMTNLFVSTACSSLPQLLLPLQIQDLNRRLNLKSTAYRCMRISILASALKFRHPKRRSVGTEYRNLSFNWMATTGGNVESAAVPTSVPVRVAHELLQAGHRYLDIRTPEEFTAGHAVGAINVPYMFKVGSGMSKNPNFLEEVSSHFGNDDEIIVGCQLGKRSLMAATDLVSAGFTGVTDIAGGYAAWTRNGLPTESSK